MNNNNFMMSPMSNMYSKPMPVSAGKVYPADQPMVFNSQNPNAPPIYPCGVCHKEVSWKSLSIKIKIWYSAIVLHYTFSYPVRSTTTIRRSSARAAATSGFTAVAPAWQSTRSNCSPPRCTPSGCATNVSPRKIYLW